MTLLIIERLSKSFGALKVIDDLDLSAESGAAIGIIGPNGAGKTTLFNLIAGALRPNTGQIVFDGHDITHAPPHARSRAGISRSFQIPRPFPELTVFENLLVAATHARAQSEHAAAADCAAILDETGLSRAADRPGGSLPLLDRKRLELARALATRPRLLLLDEIAGGLTEAECAALVTTILAIKARGVTLLWIEHIVHALNAVVDRLVVLDFGRKIAEGDPATVMASPAVRQIYMGIAA